MREAAGKTWLRVLQAVIIPLIVLSAQVRAEVWQINVEGAIGPAVADHMIRGLEQANESNAELLILRIDTPGGLDLSMRNMVKAILASEIPVVAYVAPSGARAASAGTFLLYASHLAAMAPGTNLGAATPVPVGGSSGALTAAADTTDDTVDKESTSAQESAAASSESPSRNKAVNDAVAYIESLAQLRGRNAEWAELAVRDAASLSAEDALQEDVIDLIAKNRRSLLEQLNGREIDIEGQTRTLNTAGAAVYEVPIDWRSELLSVITNPNVAYILMLIGFYGLILEFYNPGVGVPGIAGIISLLLALYAFQVLPISYSGLALIIVGIALMTTEAFTPSFGVLGLGGLVAFVVGSVMLMDTELPGYQIALPVIAAVAVASVAILVFILGMLLKARKGALHSGVELLLGKVATVETVSNDAVYARVEGELWEVHCSQALLPADTVVVDAIDGLILRVSKEKE